MRLAGPLLTAAILAVAAHPAAAATIVGLTGDRTLVIFETDAPAVTRSITVEGVDRLAGIDLRPANRTLVGVTTENVIVTIDIETGKAAEVAAMDKPLAIGDGPVIVDFNPAADRLRYMTGTTNHRVHPDTGAVTVDGSLAFEDGDMHAGETPDIVAAAYINSFGKPEKTAMFDIDATIVAVIQQTKPNDGTLRAIGKLGLADAAAPYAFDIQTLADGTNNAFLVTGGSLHTVDLATGAAKTIGKITGSPEAIRDITVLPVD